MTARYILLKTHLWLGLLAGIFIVILGVTGSIMSFQDDIEHWLHPGLWYVKAGPQAMPERELIRDVEQRFAPARVVGVQMGRQRNLAQVMAMTDHASILVNPYDGSINGRVTGPSTSATILNYIYQFHVSLIPNPRTAARSTVRAGNIVVQIAGIALCVQILIGAILWLRAKRTSIKWKASWFRVSYDLHHALGIYGALFLFVAAFTGVMTRLGEPLVAKVATAITHSPDAPRLPPPPSIPVSGTIPIDAGQAIEIARHAMPDATVDGLQLPANPKAVFMMFMRVPEDTSAAVHSYVFIDQYSGKVLQVRNFMTDSQGYRAVRMNRAIHTGDVWGLPSHIFVSLSSLLLVVMAATGIVIWWKKLAA